MKAHYFVQGRRTVVVIKDLPARDRHEPHFLDGSRAQRIMLLAALKLIPQERDVTVLDFSERENPLRIKVGDAVMVRAA